MGIDIPTEYLGESKQITIDEAKKLKRITGEAGKEFEEKVLAKQDGQFKDMYVIVFGNKLQSDGSKKLVSKLPSGKICHSKDTLILMGDMTWKKIQDVNIGDKIIGFDIKETDKRTNVYYTIAEVTHKGHRFAPTVKIETSVGDTICTSDHKWMTNNLKYLETKDFKPSQEKVDTMLRFVSKPFEHKETLEYKKGWLAGVFDGDGTIEVYEYPRKIWNGIAVKHRASLASVDIEIINRANSYIKEIFGDKWYIDKRKILKETHRQSYILRNYSKRAYLYMKSLAYDFKKEDVSDDFARGYLGGVFDAEGSYEGYHITIACLMDEQVRSRSLYFLYKFGIESKYAIAGNAGVVRILGGMQEYIKFFSLSNPVLDRKKLKFLGHRHDDSMKINSIEYNSSNEEVFSIATTTHNYVADGFISKNCFPDKSEKLDTIEQGLPYICLVYDRKVDEEGKPGREAFAKIICEEYTPKIYVPQSRLPHMVWRDKSGTLRSKAPFGNSFEDRIISAIKEMEKMGFPSVKIVFRVNERKE